jgi:predicted GTPase
MSNGRSTRPSRARISCCSRSTRRTESRRSIAAPRKPSAAPGSRSSSVANKVDDERFEGFLGEFHKLGAAEPVCISAKFNIGLGELLDAIVEHLPERRSDEDIHATDDLKIAIVGQRNAGKLTLLNAILGEDRVIVSDVPGRRAIR